VVPSLTYFQLLLEFDRGVYWPPHFLVLVRTGFWRGFLERSRCRASFENVRISDLDVADDAVIFAEMMDILMGALKALEEMELLGSRVSWGQN